MRRAAYAVILSSFVLLSSSASAGQQAVVAGRKQARASRVESGSIRFDGRLDDPAWQSAAPIVDFIQVEPNQGAEPTDPMDVRIVYDDTALWIGARMESRTAPIQAPLSRRDDVGQAEYLLVELDTYLDRRTAFTFGVTASGVRIDHYHPTDNEDDADTLYDPVWQARTSRGETWWTAELRVPFSQLRLNESNEGVFGLNVKRWRPSNNEEDYWVMVGRTERGWSSRFGDLTGLERRTPRARLEVLPYVSESSRMTGNRDLNNPFDDGRNLQNRIGVDMKTGIGSNLTLEATINPDFGQVEADPAQVNLSVFEVIFDERRPFFIEGSSVLEAGTSNYYYSRRIGARPTRSVSGDFVDYPSISQIVGAAKLTGQLKPGRSIGFLTAVTAEESALVQTAGVLREEKVAAQTTWSVGRFIQQFGTEGSTVGAHMTLVHRNLSPTEPLASQQVRTAITAGVDSRVRWANRTYEASGNVGLTFLNGETAAIARTQQASGHYLQRLDQPTIRFDPTRTTLNGAQIVGNIGKIGGRHWLWNYNVMIESPEFDPLDFGRLNYSGDVSGGPRVTYRETRPGKVFRGYSFAGSWGHYFFFDKDLGIRSSATSSNSFTWRNFWVSNANWTQYFRGQDVQATRGGPSMGTPNGWSLSTSLRNNNASRTRWNGSYTLRGNEFGERQWNVNGSLSARPSPSLQLSMTPEYLFESGTGGIFQGPIGRQYLTTLDGGRPDTYGKRYVFGLVDRTTFSTQFRVNYTFRPDVTLDVYMEPFAASVAYRGYGELQAPRVKDLRLYGTDGTTITRLADGSHAVTDGASTFTLNNYDFNRRSFRSNVVLRWEWRPGSIMYAVWQQNRQNTIVDGSHVGAGDLFGSLSAPGDNIFAIKTTLWLSR